jgi:hypothetical protein
MPKRLERPDSPANDAWMLALWTGPARHVLITEKHVDHDGDAEYRAVCLCGWRSLATPTQSSVPTVCEVGDVLDMRAHRINKDAREGLKWSEVEPNAT